MLFAPEEIANKSGKPFQAFTPMWKHYQTLEIPKISWDQGIHDFWGAPPRKRALKRLRAFVRSAPSSTAKQAGSPGLELRLLPGRGRKACYGERSKPGFRGDARNIVRRSCLRRHREQSFMIRREYLEVYRIREIQVATATHLLLHQTGRLRPQTARPARRPPPR